MILVGDIGGTNTSLAAVAFDGGRFSVGARERFATQSLGGIREALDAFRERHEEEWGRIDLCCLSGAGPVRDNVCTMTNVSFVIRGDDVARVTGVPTFIINDFSAICYALPLLDTHDEIDTLAFPHPDGTLPEPHGSIRAVVGAGTGLGTGYLTEDRGHFIAHASEGGHADFGCHDEETDGFARYLRARFDVPPGAEQYVSGQGIANAFGWFVESGRLERDEAVREIEACSAAERPGAIARHAETHGGLAGVLRFFVRLYARYASTTALFFLPSGGLYLAGGIAAKNEPWFTTDHLFMRAFETNYNERITPLLRATPVVLIRDYDVSLYGAAHAAVSLAEW